MKLSIRVPVYLIIRVVCKIIMAYERKIKLSSVGKWRRMKESSSEKSDIRDKWYKTRIIGRDISTLNHLQQCDEKKKILHEF